MKANYLSSRGDFNSASREIARQEIENQKATVCPACEQSIGNQVTAVLLKVLHDNYGFGRKKLENVMEHANMLFDMCRMDGKRYKATDCIKWLKSIGIDLEAR